MCHFDFALLMYFPQPFVAPSMTIPPANDPMWENVKKCKNFLSTLIKLASNQPPQTVKNVKQLIQGLVVSKFVPNWPIATGEGKYKSIYSLLVFGGGSICGIY